MIKILLQEPATPVNFLTQQQQAAYGQYAGEPSPQQLARYFHLDDTDRQLILRRRSTYSQLGFALQLCTVRFLGTFLSNPLNVPEGAVRYVARQLPITDWSILPKYTVRHTTRHEHAREIKQFYGYRDFNDPAMHFQLLRWLYTRIWLSDESPSMLFDLATTWLIERKILLPGATTLARCIARVRERAQRRLWRTLAQQPSPEQYERLLNLLVIPEGENQTPLDRLRRSPSRVSSVELLRTLGYLDEVRALDLANVELSHVPVNRIKALVRYAAASWAASIDRLQRDRKIATLLAFAHGLEAKIQDDVLDVLDRFLADKFATAMRAGQRERLKTLEQFDAAAFRLRDACLYLLDESLPDQNVRAVVFAQIGPEVLREALEVVDQQARSKPPHYFNQLTRSYGSVRRFLPKLLASIHVQGPHMSKPVLDAWQFLYQLDHAAAPPDFQTAPREVIQAAWRPLVIDSKRKINQRYYTFCVLHQLMEALRRRDIFVSPSNRWHDPRRKLLQEKQWEQARPKVCRTLGWTIDGQAEIRRLSTAFDETYRRVAQNFADNEAARIEQVGGRDRLVLSPLTKLEEPDSLQRLRSQVASLLPSVNLPEAMLEIHRRTGFADEFTHITETKSQVEGFSISVCAALLAEACNIGLEPVARPDIPALTKGRLLWVQQNYIRAETLIRANARLVNAQTELPLAQAWGGGEVASADGLRFSVPIRTVNAAPNPKYFGIGRGVTYFNFTSDQFTGFHSIIIPGAVREALYILDGLLEQQTSLQPVEIMADTAGYTDIVFGLFWLLGYQFSPRLADMGSVRFWRINGQADYGVLNGLARHRVKTNLIMANWDDLLRIAGSLKLGTLSASELMRVLQRRRRPSTLAKAVSELGRIAKTLYLLNYVADEAYRRRVLTQLNRGEGRHRIARAVFHGRRGEIRKRYREGQEDQLGALGLVVNILVLWNTFYMDAALDHLREKGEAVLPEDVTRLSPLVTKHINFLGRYEFNLPEYLKQGQMRPLRDPLAADRYFLQA